MWLDRNHYTTSLFFNCLILLCLWWAASIANKSAQYVCSLCWLFIYLSSTSIQGLSLSSSPSSEDGIISVCPATTVTLTCTASEQTFLTWRQVTLLHTFFADDYETEETRTVQRSPYTLTLVSVDNVNGAVADFTSTLEVMEGDISNGTSITCQVFNDEDHLTIIKTSKK